MTTEINKVQDVIVGEYGLPINLQLVDSDGVPINLSTYTGITVYANAPNDIESLSFTGSFTSGGSDGKLFFTPSISNYFTVPGLWQGQVKLTKTGVVAKTIIFDIFVKKTLA